MNNRYRYQHDIRRLDDPLKPEIVCAMVLDESSFSSASVSDVTH